MVNAEPCNSVFKAVQYHLVADASAGNVASINKATVSMGFATAQHWIKPQSGSRYPFVCSCVDRPEPLSPGLVHAGSKLQLSSSLHVAGLRDGDEVSCVLGGDDVKVGAHKFGFGFGAIINGSLKIWGCEPYFQMSATQRKRLENDVLEVFFTETAVAAIKANGEVVTCGDRTGGGDSEKVQDQLVDVTSITGTMSAFSALRADGKVVCWGDPDDGGDSSHVQGQLCGIRHVFPCQHAFAAVTEAGRVVTWGRPDEGGDSSQVQDELFGVRNIVASVHAFAALRRDGQVVTWGSCEAGGDSSSVREKLRKVRTVYASKFAFAAVKEEGTVVTWGPAEHGGLTAIRSFNTMHPNPSVQSFQRLNRKKETKLASKIPLPPCQFVFIAKFTMIWQRTLF